MDLIRYSRASVESAATKPNSLVSSSRGLPWKALLLDVHQGRGCCDPFDVHATPDLTVVVALDGRHQIDVLKHGGWRRAVYEPGATGLIAPSETRTLRWQGIGKEGFRTAHLYLAADLVSSIRDEYRRGTASSVDVPVAELAFRDPAVAHAVAALVEARDANAPDLYAEQTARWLTTHLLARHGRVWDLEEDGRSPGLITDRRLARVIEYIGTHLGDHLGLEELAREAGISVHHFGRVFYARVGTTPHAYVQGQRFDLAQRLLATTDLPVGDIAFRCGYQRQSAFSAAFQRRIGNTPSQYRSFMRRERRSNAQ